MRARKGLKRMRLQRRTDPAPGSPPLAKGPPFISVIVPVRNEERFIRTTLDQLLHQDYDPDRFEILVADGRSTDATRAIVAECASRFPHVRLLDNPRRWSSAGRNQALRAAHGDLVVIVDGHCEIDRVSYLREVAEAFQRSGADCVGRPQPLDVTGATALQRAVAAARSSRLGHHPDSYIYSSDEGFVPPQSVAVAYSRSVFEQIGLFDESFDACEDVEFNHRVAQAGLRCYFTPRVAARYVPRGSLGGLFRQMVRYGRGRARLSRKHPDTFSLRGFVPAAFVAGLVLGPLLALLSPLLAALYAGTLGLYAAAVLAVSLTITLRARRLALLPWLPLVFATIHLGSGAGILLELVTGRRRAEGRLPRNLLRPATEPEWRRAA
jgi:succinoglycan biosynthesis protein ExoA